MSWSWDELQALLEVKTTCGLSYSVVAHIRWDLRQIFRMAVAEGYLVKVAESLYLHADAEDLLLRKAPRRIEFGFEVGRLRHLLVQRRIEGFARGQ